MKPQLYLGDCLEVMKDIPDKSVDLVLTDPPYGTTARKWDSVIPFEPMWEQLNRLIKPNGAIVLFGSEPFSSALRMSNIKNYKYDWIWEKDKSTNHLNCEKQPLRRTENISVFYNNQCLYNPQIQQKHPADIRPPTTKRVNTGCYGEMTKLSERKIPEDMSYPHETLFFNSCFGVKGKSFHETEKPVDLGLYFLKTYTNIGDVVLDFTMGSGTFGVACKISGRNFIGIEDKPATFKIAQDRINQPVERPLF